MTRPRASVWLVAALCLPLLSSAEPTIDGQRVLYAVGYKEVADLSRFHFTPQEIQTILRGVVDGMNGGGARRVEGVPIDTVLRRIAARANRAFLTHAAREKGAKKFPSGLILVEEKAGTGATPGPTDVVRLNFRGFLKDGMEIENTYQRGAPVDFQLQTVIACWSEAFQKLKIGAKAKLTCPPDIAFGDKGFGPSIPAGEVVVYEVELLATGPGPDYMVHLDGGT